MARICTITGRLWAPLNGFESADRLGLIAACHCLNLSAGALSPWADGAQP